MPAHAQRMSSLLASDKEGVFCRWSKGGLTMRGEVNGPGGGGRQATAAKAACGVEGATADWEQGIGEERTENM